MRTRYGGNLESPSARAKLKARREPYWVTLHRGCAIGYRKGSLGGTWIARRIERSADGKHAKHYEALGPADDLNDGQGLTYKQAHDEARRLFGVPAAASAKLTVADALDAYLRRLDANNPASTAYDARTRIEGVLKPAIGHKLLAKLTTADLHRFLDELREDRAPDTVNRLWALLKAALNLAWRERKVADDAPWRMVRAAKIKANARKVFLTAAQCRALLKHCKPPALRRLVQAGLLTGARSGELAALKVQDFDPASGTLECSGKTGARIVYLSSETVAFFADCAKGKAPSALLLPREDGAAWGKNHHQKPFIAAVKRAQLPAETVFYSLRHTHISLGLVAGVNIQVLAENTGTSVRMIEKHYGKFLNRDRRAMFDLLPGIT